MNCPKCKKEVPEDSTYCMHCGEPVDKNHTSYRKMAIIALIICLVLLALNVVQLINNKNLRAEYNAYTKKMTTQTEETIAAE